MSSNTDVMISVRGLSKSYALGHGNKDKATTIAEAAIRRLRSPFRPAPNEIFWALKDVSFDVRRGDVVGVIGRNGAGKSTLFKVLSRITEPTDGEVHLYGRVGSLLEVGTGFSGELTGRENIYLNGTILGMRRAEISSRFDEIVDFAGVEKFLDTPVKRYSSGMYVRLAFAVAAHLRNEVLILDEVLAVGDLEFQKKCLGKINDVRKDGRTVLLVSHNMGTVRESCTHGVVLQDGRVSYDGNADEAVEQYFSSLSNNAKTIAEARTDRRGKGENRFLSAEIRGNNTDVVTVGQTFMVSFVIGQWSRSTAIQFTVYDRRGQPVTNANTKTITANDRLDNNNSKGSCKVTFRCDECLFVPGQYRINAALYEGDMLQDHLEGIATFNVHPGTIRGRGMYAQADFGSIALPHCWDVCPVGTPCIS